MASCSVHAQGKLYLLPFTNDGCRVILWAVRYAVVHQGEREQGYQYTSLSLKQTRTSSVRIRHSNSKGNPWEAELKTQYFGNYGT